MSHNKKSWEQKCHQLRIDGTLPTGMTTKEVFEKLSENDEVKNHSRYLIIGEKENHKFAMQMSFYTKKSDGGNKTGITKKQVKRWLKEAMVTECEFERNGQPIGKVKQSNEEITQLNNVFTFGDFTWAGQTATMMGEIRSSGQAATTLGEITSSGQTATTMGEITSSGQAATMLGEITSSGQAATMMPVDNDREETPLKSTNSPATSICNNSESLVSLPRMTTTPVEILELQHTATDPTQDENVLTSTNSPATSICNNSELLVSLPRTPTTPFGKLEF